MPEHFVSCNWQDDVTSRMSQSLDLSIFFHHDTPLLHEDFTSLRQLWNIKKSKKNLVVKRA